jgi:hypothetical protein
VPVATGQTDAGVDPSTGIASQTVCNPVTNAGCSGSDICAIDNSFMFYYCQPGGSPNTAACGDCTNSGPCAAGSGCYFIDQDAGVAQCFPQCCTNDDCGANGACALLSPDGGLGVCVPM